MAPPPVHHRQLAAEGVVRVTVIALGDYTSSLHHLLEPGMPAVIGVPHGRFDHTKGTRDRVWIAGGVGVAPFLSWMRALAEHPPPGRVDLYYAFTGGPAPFAEELSTIGAASDIVRVHLVDSAVAGRLSAERIMAEATVEPAQLSVFLCGPSAMLRDLQRAGAGSCGRTVAIVCSLSKSSPSTDPWSVHMVPSSAESSAPTAGPGLAAQDPLPDVVDVVVVGAGHNGLTAAAYLASAGLEVLVLEANAEPGGNTRTEELTLPGFAHDSCSSAHVLVQSNPLLRDDELGLLADHGLRYLHTDPAVVLPQPDGDALVMHRDLDATVEELARWSARDAASFRSMVEEWTSGLAAVHGRWSSGLDLGGSASVDSYRTLRERSAWDVVHARFEHPTVRAFVAWLAMATIQDPRRPGTGFLPSSLSVGRLAFGWSTPVGGSAALPTALADHLRANGGRLVCAAPVAAVEVSGDRAHAVRTTDGRRVEARRAVVVASHLARLAGMVEGAEPSPDLLAARDGWRPGLSVFAVHAALRGNLGFHGRSGPVPAAAGGLGTPQGLADQIDALHRGEQDARDPWLLVVNQTVVDPGRAPEGQGTFKILTIAPYERADGRSWEESKDGYAAELVDLVRQRTDGLDATDILALRAESPVDVAAHNPHNLGGSCHGGEFVDSAGRVIPGWPDYRTGIEGLFLTGATSHPGGSVSGRPGRNTARVVLTRLGVDPATVMGPG